MQKKKIFSALPDSRVKEKKGKRIIPTLLIDDVPYSNPDNARLKELLKLEKEEEKTVYDLVIVGAGAAGLTTAIYAQRDKLSSIILEKKQGGTGEFLHLYNSCKPV